MKMFKTSSLYKAIVYSLTIAPVLISTPSIATSLTGNELNSTTVETSMLQRQNQELSALWKSHALTDYADLLADIPDPANIAQRVLKQKYPNIDPDRTFYVYFGEEGRSAHNFLGWDHFTPIHAMTMTQAALIDTFSLSSPDVLNSVSGFYTVGAGAKIYDSTNLVRVSPEDVAKTVWDADLQTQFDNEVEKFWNNNLGKFVSASKDAFRVSGYSAFQKNEISRSALTMIQDVLDQNASVNIYHMDIYGYSSPDILWIEPSTNQGSKLLYIPGAKKPFIEVSSLTELREKLVTDLKSTANRTALAEHFTIYDRQDGTSYSGVNSALKGIANGQWASSYIMTKHSRISEDTFQSVAKAVMARNISDGDMQIKSNSEVTRDTALRTIGAIINLLPAMQIVEPEISIPLDLVILNATSLGLNINKAVTGDTEAERNKGALGAGLDSGFLAASIIPVAKKLSDSIKTSASQLHPTGNVADIIESSVPAEYDRLNVGDNPVVVTHPQTQQELYIVRLTDTKRVVAMRRTPSGTFIETNFESGRDIANSRIVETTDPVTNRRQFLDKGGLLGGGKRGFKLKLNAIDPNVIPTASTIEDGYSIDKRKLIAESNGANYFHGSRSSSLLTFKLGSETNGAIEPMGQLIEKRVFPFSGEAGNSLAENAANRNLVSVVTLDEAGSAYDYATNTSRAAKFNIDVATNEATENELTLLQYSVSPSIIDDIKAGNAYAHLDGIQSEVANVARGKLALNNNRVIRFNGLAPAEKQLVQEEFPIMYGFDPSEFNIEPIQSDIKGEFGVRGGVPMNEIKVIYTTADKVSEVSAYLNDNNIHIPTKSFKDIQFNANEGAAGMSNNLFR